MPRQSSVQVPSNPGKASTKLNPDGYKCIRCGRHFKKQTNNFPKLQSPMYMANDGFSPICRHCFIEMLNRYTDVLGDEKEAVRRMCLKFDIYWTDAIWDMLAKTNASNSRILAYISKANLVMYAGKTYDDTLDEERQIELDNAQALVISELQSIKDSGDDADVVDATAVPQEVIDYWGSGLPPEMYLELEKRLAYWNEQRDTSVIDLGAEALLRQVCILEVSIIRDIAAGKSVDKQTNTLNTLLGSLNLKPIQKQKDAMSSLLTEKPLGVVWQMIEEEEPIPEADEEFQDVDGIRRYVMIWFFGALCNMLNVNNKYSRLYNEEIERLKVERPEYEGEDDETIIEDIFERAEREAEERRKALELEGEETDDGEDADTT